MDRLINLRLDTYILGWSFFPRGSHQHLDSCANIRRRRLTSILSLKKLNSLRYGCNLNGLVVCFVKQHQYMSRYGSLDFCLVYGGCCLWYTTIHWFSQGNVFLISKHFCQDGLWVLAKYVGYSRAWAKNIIDKTLIFFQTRWNPKQSILHLTLLQGVHLSTSLRTWGK